MGSITGIITELPAYEIVPLNRVGPVQLGMTRQQARSAMNRPVNSFRKTPFSISPTDAFHENSFQLFYDEADRVEYIELSHGSIKAMYKGISVFDTKAEELISFILREAAYDEKDKELGSSYIFPALELSLWRPFVPDKNQDIDDPDGRYFYTIGIGKKGYYSSGLA